MNSKHKIFLILAFLVMCFIFYISSLEKPYNPYPERDIVPIIYHFGIFFLLSLSLLLSGKINRKFFFIALSLSFVYAALDELHQYFVPGRSCSLFDFEIDSAGIIISLIVISLIKNNPRT